MVPPEDIVAEVPMNRLSRWALLQKMAQIFWQRWSSEYINQLFQRVKWHTVVANIRVGSIVLIRNEILPATKWPLGKVLDVHPRHDGNVRNVTVLFNGKEHRRKKVCLLPVDPSESLVEPQLQELDEINQPPMDSSQLQELNVQDQPQVAAKQLQELGELEQERTEGDEPQLRRSKRIMEKKGKK